MSSKNTKQVGGHTFLREHERGESRRKWSFHEYRSGRLLSVHISRPNATNRRTLCRVSITQFGKRRTPTISAEAVAGGYLPALRLAWHQLAPHVRRYWGFSL